MLPVTFAHAERAGKWPQGLGDPFDRMLASQSDIEHTALATNDDRIKQIRMRHDLVRGASGIGSFRRGSLSLEKNGIGPSGRAERSDPGGFCNILVAGLRSTPLLRRARVVQARPAQSSPETSARDFQHRCIG
jgi:hypothetical protein